MCAVFLSFSLSSDFKPIKLKITENHLNLSYAQYPLDQFELIYFGN